MTSTHSEREAIADELLLDDDFSGADPAEISEVRQVLLSMASLASLPAPAPGAELAAMIAGPHDELSKRRWRHQHRTAVVGVAVVAAMGLGVSGVAAASSGFTRSPSFINELLGTFIPQPTAAPPALPAPDAPKVSTEPAPAVDPAAIPPAAIPPATQAPVVSVPASPQVQQPAPAEPVPAPEAAQPVPGSPQVQLPAPAPKPAAPDPASQQKAPNLRQETQHGKEKQLRQNAPQPNPLRQEAVKSGNSVPGWGGVKTGEPGLPQTGQQNEAWLREAMDKLTQWKKQGGR